MLRRTFMFLFIVVMVMGIAGGCSPKPAPPSQPQVVEVTRVVEVEVTRVVVQAPNPTSAPATPIPTPQLVAQANEAKFKVAFVYVAPVGDMGWTWAHDQGRLYVEKVLGDKVETAYVENVPEGPEAERVIRDFAQKGYQLIFTTSFGFMDPTVAVAKEFPKTWFVHISGYKTADNVSTVFGRMEQARYLSGLATGAATKSNIVGFVAAFPIPEVIRGINAFTLGVREVNPTAEVRVVWTNTWFDPPKEKEAADALLAAGADVIAQHQDTTEPQKAAAEAGKVSVGYDSDMGKFVGDTVLTSPIWNWGPKYVEIVEKVMDGSYQAEAYYGSMADGIVELAPLSPRVDQATADKIALVRAAIRDGTWDVFCGPVKGVNGKTVVPEGNCLTDPELLSMDYWVEGVKGDGVKEAPESLGQSDTRAAHKPGAYKPSLVIVLTTFTYPIGEGQWGGESGPFLNAMGSDKVDVSDTLPWCDMAYTGFLHGQRVLQVTLGTLKVNAAECAADLVRSHYIVGEPEPWVVMAGISGFSPRLGGYTDGSGKQLGGEITQIGDVCIAATGSGEGTFSSMTQQTYWPLNWPNKSDYYKGSEFLAEQVWQASHHVEWPVLPPNPTSNVEKYFPGLEVRLPVAWYQNCAELTSDNFWHSWIDDDYARTWAARALATAYGVSLSEADVIAVTAMENEGWANVLEDFNRIGGTYVPFMYVRSSSNFDQPPLNAEGKEAVDPATSIREGMSLGGDEFGALTEFLVLDKWLEELTQ